MGEGLDCAFCYHGYVSPLFPNREGGRFNICDVCEGILQCEVGARSGVRINPSLESEYRERVLRWAANDPRILGEVAIYAGKRLCDRRPGPEEVSDSCRRPVSKKSSEVMEKRMAQLFEVLAVITGLLALVAVAASVYLIRG